MSSDFLAAIADHLNRAPSMCQCGHPSVLHADVGCLASVVYDDICPCVADGRDAVGRAPCRCGHVRSLHTGADGCTVRFPHDSGSDVCPCEEGR